MSRPYDPEFYSACGSVSLDSARATIPLVMELLDPIESVVDVGCGTGTWLKAFAEAGVGDYLGLDGHYVSPDQLEIPAAQFQATDIGRPVHIRRRFDLVVCLEVAEHLAATAADDLVDSLTRLGDTVLFSAAIPLQGGLNHLNEQWPEYWAEKFRARGWLVLDPFRSRLWADERVSPWYAQNLVLYVTPSSVGRHPGLQGSEPVAEGALPALVHPGVYLPKARTAQKVARLYESAPARWWRRIRA